MAAAALAALRAATSECAAAAGRFSSKQCAAGVALAHELDTLFTVAAAAAENDRHAGSRRAPSLPHLPTELLLQVVRNLDVRDLGRLACTCRQLYFGPPGPPRPASVVEEELRRRAAAAGRRLPLSPSAGVSGLMPALLQSEWRDSLGLGTAVAGISPHSLFIDANGALMVCGFEREPGTLGLPQSQDDSENEADSEDEEDEFRTVLEPTFVPSMAGIRIRQVVAGCDCSLAVSEAGRMYMWGRGGDGRLASDTENREEPTMIQELSHHRVRQVAIAIDLCAAVTEEGLLFTWATASTAEDYDGNREAEQGPPRLGLGLDDTNGQWPPQCVTALKDERVGSVAIGRGFTLVTTEAGAVFSFGDGNNGSLGHDDYDTHILPKRVEALDGVYVAAVAAGYHQSLALTACGRVFWWERRIQSATQHEWQPLPQQVHSAFGGGRVRSIAATFFTAYAVTDAGELFAWGCDSHAQASGLPLGNGNCQVQLSPWPVAGLHGITVVGVSAGQLHTLVLAADGSVYGFGLGYSLGIGSGVGGEWYPEDLEGDAADEVEGQMILAETGDRIQLTPKKIPGLVCSVPRTLQNS